MMAKQKKWVCFAIIGSAIVANCSVVVPAADDSAKFIDALRQRQYFDTAADYLDHLAADPAASVDSKGAILYQQALILIEEAAAEHNPQTRAQRLEQAQSKLKAFLASNPDGELSITAHNRLGDLLRYRAAGLLKSTVQTDGENSASQKQAQTLLQDAITQFSDSATRLHAQLDSLPKGEQPERREKIGLQWLDARLNVLSATFDLAQTSDNNSDQRRQWLTDVAAQAANLYGRFPKLKGGWFAHYYEARSYEELGKPTKALATYQDLMVDLTESDASFRQLKTQAIRQSLGLLLQAQDYTTAVDRSLAWAKSAKGDELIDPDWLAVKLSTATALKGLAETSSKKDPKVSGYLRDARELLGEVIASNNAQFQQAARELLAQLSSDSELAVGASPTSKGARSTNSTLQAGGNRLLLQFTADSKSAPDGSTNEPVRPADLKEFDSAFDKVGEIVDDMMGTQTELSSDEEDQKPDAKHIAELKSQLARKQKDLLPLCQRVLELSNSRTDLEKLNKIRYLVCYFNYTQKNYYDAAVVGEWLARNYPQATDAISSARVAMAALDALQRENNRSGGDTTFEAAKLQSLAEYVVAHWPKQPEASVAMDVLLNSTLTSGDFEKALKMVNSLPADSQTKAEAEIRLGHAMWSKYLRRLQELRNQKAAGGQNDSTVGSLDDPKVKGELNDLIQQAQKLLEQGLARLGKSEETNESAVLAAVSLAQLYVNQSSDNKAVALLENPKYGPLTLLKTKDPATQTEGIPAEIYKTALHAYIGADPQQLDKATDALNGLEKIYSNDTASEAKLTQLMVGIAYDLEQQLDELNRQGDHKKAAHIAQSFDKFLDRIAQRTQTADFKTLVWVARTYETLAEKMMPAKDAPADKPSPEGAAIYQKAAEIYEAMLARLKTEPKFLPADRVLAVKQSLAIDDRNAGKYAQAIDTFAGMLKERPNLLQTQIEAARTYQMRGANENADWYTSAINGGTGPSESIWGWGKMAAKIANLPKYRDLFHEARYNIALCHQKFGESLTDASKQQKQFEMAKDAIRTTRQFEPTFDDGKWKPQNEKLLRQLQNQLDQPVVGLLEFEPKSIGLPETEQKKRPAN